MSTIRPKKKDTSTLNLRENASTASSLANTDHVKRRNVVLWPEWSDADIITEKWEGAPHSKVATKDKGSKAVAVTPVMQMTHFFDDPEGKCELPLSLKAFEWKRPSDFITEKTPVVVDMESVNSFNLVTPNNIVHMSETMRWITSQIYGLWNLSEVKLTDGAVLPELDPINFHESMLTHSWRPWEHIYALTKPGKGGTTMLNIPPYNPYGKYVVKLFFMGCWRKVVVDDMMPFDCNGNLLLPMTTLQHELWPMLLAKALLKVAALDYSAGGTTCEFGDFNVIHCLTGWLPEIVRLPCDCKEDIWKLLNSALPQFTLPTPPPDEPTEGVHGVVMDAAALALKDEKAEKTQNDKADKAARESKKDTRGLGKKKGEKDEREKLKLPVLDEQTIPDHPQMVVFAIYHGPPTGPARITKKKEMADAYESLRQHGFSHCYPHPVLLTQTRACPLELPPPVEKVPAWKTVRPRKKPDEDRTDKPEPDKPIQSVLISSPFMNHMMPPLSDSATEATMIEEAAAEVKADNIGREKDDNAEELHDDVTQAPLPSNAVTTGDTRTSQSLPKTPTKLPDDTKTDSMSPSRKKKKVPTATLR